MKAVSLPDSRNQGEIPPEGYVTIPIYEDQSTSRLRICVLARREPDPVAGHLVMLRDSVNAQVFLGCIADLADTVHDWLEIWIQNGQALAGVTAAARQALSNAMLDLRWQGLCQAFEQTGRQLIVRTGWEGEHPRPIFLDISKRVSVHPVDDGTGNAWRLCTDEGLLQDKGLAGYAGSLHRYWYVPELGGDSHFVPVTAGAPTNEYTRPMPDILGDLAAKVPLNAQAGLMLVRKYVPMGLETFAGILSGKPWEGLRQGKSVLNLDGTIYQLRPDYSKLDNQGWLFLDTQGHSGRLLETFHLKLRLLADLVSSAHRLVRRLQRPLFSLQPGSWQIELGAAGPGLPFLWTGRVVLNDPGDAVSLVVPGTDFEYYLPSQAGETSVYHPLESTLPVRGRAAIRIRQVVSSDRGSTSIDGTLTTQERIETARHDLAWFRLHLACGDISLYAHLEADSALAAGEWRFRTIAQDIDETMLSCLREAEGVPVPDVTFEVVRLLSTPCDLYALAVVALRILLVDTTNSLATVVDEAMSLLRQMEVEADGTIGIEQRISEVAGSDPRWLQALGPHHLTVDDITADEALAAIPARLWWPALAVILQMFPGPGPYRACKDYGDAPQGSLHEVFERTMEHLDRLIRRTRSLVVMDWKANQEVLTVLQDFLR